MDSLFTNLKKRGLWLILITGILHMLIACDNDTQREGDEVSQIDRAGEVAGGIAGVSAGDEAGDTAGETIAVECGERPEVPTSECSFIQAEQGVARKLFIQATILTADDILENSAVLIDLSQENSRILCVGCECESMTDRETARLICPDGVVSPGLINPHDQLGWSTANPIIQRDGERYDHRHDWRMGYRNHTRLSVGDPNNRTPAVLFGELRMLMSGTTSIAGSSHAFGLLRNLDEASFNGGLGDFFVDYRLFPLGDSNGRLQADSCENYNIDDPSRLNNHIYMPYLAEGIDPEAQNEFACLSGTAPGSEDLIAENTSIIHGIGLSPVDILSVATEGAKLVWSPQSNIQLYGHTANILSYKNAGVTIALGTDRITSGSMNMLRALKCADQLNADNFGTAFTDRELWQMATKNGAIALGLSDRIGSIEEGYIADLVIYQAGGRDPYRAVIEASPEKVSLVLRGGTALYGDENIINGLSMQSCEVEDVCGVNKSICSESDSGVNYDTLKSFIDGGAYPLFFCGEPENEPSCIPSRLGEFTGMSQPDDQDGDGVIDATDNCPTVFNAPRPLEGNVQGDADFDGIGDACDVCPLDDNVDCTMFNPDDIDGDLIEDREDNCVGITNPDQADQDNDMIGDLCDPCPESSNLNGAVCPSTIYAIKRGEVTGTVTIKGIVTAVEANGQGFFIQIPQDYADYEGPEYSATYVFTGNAAEGLTFPRRGQEIKVTGTPDNYYGQLQLNNVTDIELIRIVTEASVVLPTNVSPQEVGRSGARSTALEGVLINLNNVTVTAVGLEAGPGDRNPTNEFEVDNTLPVNDFFYLIRPTPEVGQTIERLVGTLRYANNAFKLEPRGFEDITLDPPSIDSFSAMNALSIVGQTSPLRDLQGEEIRLTMSGFVSAGGERIILNVTPTGIIDVPNEITVPAGSNQVLIEATGVSAGQATLTASLEGRGMASLDVEVIDPDTEPTELTFPTGGIVLGPQNSVRATVTFDYPAPSDYELNVSVSSSLVTAPTTIAVNEGAFSASFEINPTGSLGRTSLEISARGVVASTPILVTDVPFNGILIINEIDSNLGVDRERGEFIELYNASASSLNLADYRLELVNGMSYTSSVYRSYDLGDLGVTLGSGRYLVIAGPDIEVGPDVISGVLPTSGIQDGSPDGVRIVNIHTGAVIDGMSYGNGSVSGVTEGSSTPNDRGYHMILSRCPNGADTNSNNQDFTITSVGTPGTANSCD